MTHDLDTCTFIIPGLLVKTLDENLDFCRQKSNAMGDYIHNYSSDEFIRNRVAACQTAMNRGATKWRN